LALLGLLAVGYLLLISSAGAGISTERVSVASDGSEANDVSYMARITSNGRYVVFTSVATNLAAGDTNYSEDVFVHDRYTDTTERVSVASDGTQGNGSSGGWGATISINDGRYVAFGSDATNLVAGDTNGRDDVFVHDRLTGVTERVNVDSAGNQANGSGSWGWGPAISGDGRYVAFVSSATNLVPDDTNGRDDIFVHDREEDTTERVSVDSDGNQSNGSSGFLGIAINADGRYVAFDSYATNLVPGDTNGVPDLFLRDRLAGTTERVSVDSAGNQANGWSDVEAISPNGSYVAFTSVASNLVPDDTYTCSGWPSCEDVFIHDRNTGVTERVSVDSDENQANGASFFPAISGDLRYVAFYSDATNLVPDDTNGYGDVFLRDRLMETTTLISVSSDGEQGDWVSGANGVAIGLDSRFIAYDSVATNLVPDDTNNFSDIFVDPPVYDPPPTFDPVGGIAELPEIARGSGSSAGTYAALAGGLAAALLVLTASAWYARRRFSR
jgi:Tol biopolymer transport system component